VSSQISGKLAQVRCPISTNRSIDFFGRPKASGPLFDSKSWISWKKIGSRFT